AAVCVDECAWHECERRLAHCHVTGEWATGRFLFFSKRKTEYEISERKKTAEPNNLDDPSTPGARTALGPFSGRYLARLQIVQILTPASYVGAAPTGIETTPHRRL